MHLISFSEIAEKYLKNIGFEPFLCDSEKEARSLINELPKLGKWPCLFTSSDTTGEKDFEEFYTKNETLDFNSFSDIGIIKNELSFNDEKLNFFESKIAELRLNKKWNKSEILQLFKIMVSDFRHKETGKYLDSKM